MLFSTARSSSCTSPSHETGSISSPAFLHLDHISSRPLWQTHLCEEFRHILRDLLHDVRYAHELAMRLGSRGAWRS
jgi:hypothetical protein